MEGGRREEGEEEGGARGTASSKRGPDNTERMGNGSSGGAGEGHNTAQTGPPTGPRSNMPPQIPHRWP
eukprot:4217594-Pyramimonas_sp.AAC.1